MAAVNTGTRVFARDDKHENSTDLLTLSDRINNCADDSAPSTTLCVNTSLPRTRQQLIQRIHNFLTVLGQGTQALTELIERH